MLNECLTWQIWEQHEKSFYWNSKRERHYRVFCLRRRSYIEFDLLELSFFRLISLFSRRESIEIIRRSLFRYFSLMGAALMSLHLTVNLHLAGVEPTCSMSSCQAKLCGCMLRAWPVTRFLSWFKKPKIDTTQRQYNWGWSQCYVNMWRKSLMDNEMTKHLYRNPDVDLDP